MQNENQEQVPFMHPVTMRNRLERLIGIDCKYMRVTQPLNVEEFRTEHQHIYWNLIWYITEEKLPYEFLIPYDEEYLRAKDELMKATQHIKCQNKLRVSERE